MSDKEFLCVAFYSDSYDFVLRGCPMQEPQRALLTTGQRAILFDVLKEQLPKGWSLNEETTVWLMGLVDTLADELLYVRESGELEIRYTGFSKFIEIINQILHPSDDETKK